MKPLRLALALLAAGAASAHNDDACAIHHGIVDQHANLIAKDP